MKNTFRLIGIIGGTDAAYTKPKCSFAKAKLRGLKIAGMLFLILMFGFGIISCDEPDNPKDQSEIITGLFDNDSSATVKGFFTNAEWNGVANKIKTALNNRFDTAPVDAAKIMLRRVYTQTEGVMIIVERSTEYANWKTTGDGKTMYINFNIINDEDTLMTSISTATVRLDTNTEDMY